MSFTERVIIGGWMSATTWESWKRQSWYGSQAEERMCWCEGDSLTMLGCLRRAISCSVLLLSESKPRDWPS
jgi:hypothetical protein